MTELKQNKKPVKFDFKNLTKEQKEKGIGYSFVGLVVIGFFVYGISNYTSDEETTVDEFTTPQSELTQYNNKTDAINKKAQDNTSDGNLAMQFSNDSTKLDHGVNFDALDQQIANAGNNSGSQPTFSPAPSSSGSSGSSNHNQHSTYGDYSMWQAEEPKNNSIAYTEVKNYPTSSRSKNENASSNIDYTEISEPAYVQPSYNGSSTNQRSINEGKQIRAKLLSKGYANSGRTLSFVLLESTKIGTLETPKGQIITGVASEQNNRLLVNFSTIKVKNKIVPVQLQLYGADGMAGLPISPGTQNSDLENRALNESSRIPVIGGVINSVGNAMSKQSDNRIKLTSNVECIIVNFN